MSPDPSWNAAQRLEGLAGEVRVNLIRLVALVAFYGHHLVNVFLIRDDPSLKGAYHTVVTTLVLAWALAVLIIHYCLMRRWIPPVLKYVVTVWDILLITTLLMAGGDGRSGLAVLYFLVIVAAPLRLSLPLVWTATLGTMAGYAFFLGFVRWRLELPIQQRLSRPQQVVYVLALGAAGLLAGQFVRQCRRLVYGTPVPVEEEVSA
ncbi:MAG: hypothetical protein ACRELF_03885 [Gemmataceae bacterium]